MWKFANTESGRNRRSLYNNFKRRYRMTRNKSDYDMMLRMIRTLILIDHKRSIREMSVREWRKYTILKEESYV